MDACEIGFGAFPAECPHRSDLFSERILAPRGNRDVQKRRPDEGERPIQPELDPAVGDRTAVAVDHAGRRTGARQPAVGARDPTQDAVGHSHGFRTVFDGQAATATYQDGVGEPSRRRYGQRLQHVVKRPSTRPPVCTRGGELAFVVAHSHAKHHPLAGQRGKRAQLFGQPKAVAQWDNQNRCAEFDSLRAARQERDRGQRIPGTRVKDEPRGQQVVQTPQRVEADGLCALSQRPKRATVRTLDVERR